MNGDVVSLVPKVPNPFSNMNISDVSLNLSLSELFEMPGAGKVFATKVFFPPRFQKQAHVVPRSRGTIISAPFQTDGKTTK